MTLNPQPAARQALEEDLAGAEFRVGLVEGRWGLPDADLEPILPPWPAVVLWVAAAARETAPDRFYVRLDCTGYPTAAPTGTFWDPSSGETLSHEKRPKGRDRVARVFRTDWNGGNAFYHPYDRATADHAAWPRDYPALIWSRDHTIVDFLTVIHGLLNCSEYTGV